MIKLENVVLANPEQMKFIIEGMRNPMNSWEKSDSGVCLKSLPCHSCHENRNDCKKNIDSGYVLGENDHSLMQRLAKSGTDHRKYMRMMPVYVRITAPLYWWKEFDTYKLGTVSNSCSTMHKIAEKEFTLEDFSCEHLLCGGMLDDVPNNDGKWVRFNGIDCLKDTIGMLNKARDLYLLTKDKRFWWQMIQLLPSSYNQTRNVFLNYEVLANIYKSRKNHKLDEWREFCKWIEELPYSELITGLSIESDQAFEEKRFSQPFPWIKDAVYCNNCEHFRDCLNKGRLVNVTTSDDIAKNCFGPQRYINKPGYNYPKEDSDNE